MFRNSDCHRSGRYHWWSRGDGECFRLLFDCFSVDKEYLHRNKDRSTYTRRWVNIKICESCYFNVRSCRMLLNQWVHHLYWNAIKSCWIGVCIVMICVKSSIFIYRMQFLQRFERIWTIRYGSLLCQANDRHTSSKAELPTGTEECDKWTQGLDTAKICVYALCTISLIYI